MKVKGFKGKHVQGIVEPNVLQEGPNYLGLGYGKHGKCSKAKEACEVCVHDEWNMYIVYLKVVVFYEY